MTDKEEIIINGVDVSDCEYLTYQLEEDGEYYWFCDIAPAGGPDECEYKNCYYKQLVRKIQEYEQLEEKYEALKSERFTRESLISIQEEDIDRYRMALEEIKKVLSHCVMTGAIVKILYIINKAKGE